MRLELLIEKLENAARSYEESWQDERVYEFLENHELMNEAAKQLKCRVVRDRDYALVETIR